MNNKINLIDNYGLKKHLSELFLPKKEHRIRIEVINLNNETLEKCLDSILNQKYENWLCFVDKMDNSKYDTNKNIIEGITYMDYKDSDICIRISSEDFFNGEYCFFTINKIFNNNNYLVLTTNYLDNNNVLKNGSLMDYYSPMFFRGVITEKYEDNIKDTNIQTILNGLDNEYISNIEMPLMTKSILNKDSKVIDINKWDLKKDIVLYAQGGLGDHLSMSNLPYEYYKRGYKVKLLSMTNGRNSEIVDFVWSKNPYIYETVDYLLPSDILIGHLNKAQLNSTEFIQKIEETNGINSNNKYPTIYYTPKIKHELMGKCVLNLDCITANYDSEEVKQIVNDILYNLNIKEYDVLNMILTKDTNTNTLYDKNVLKTFGQDEYYNKFNKLKCSNIEEHCDIINSCKYYITLMSGGAALAACIDKNKERTFVIVNKEEHRISTINKSFVFDNQNYIF